MYGTMDRNKGFLMGAVGYISVAPVLYATSKIFGVIVVIAVGKYTTLQQEEIFSADRVYGIGDPVHIGTIFC